MMILITLPFGKKIEKAALITAQAPINTSNGCASTTAFLCKSNKNFTSRTPHLPDGYSYLHLTDGEMEALTARRVTLRGFAQSLSQRGSWATWLLLRMLTITRPPPFIPLSTFLVSVQLHTRLPFNNKHFGGEMYTMVSKLSQAHQAPSLHTQWEH